MGSRDFRSDTLTKPTPAMRRAMAEAEVGDDVYGEDPTVNRLQEMAASLLGHEAALFVPTGSMGNQIAIHLQAGPGDEVLLETSGHTVQFELGAMAAITGAMPRCLDGERGLLDADQVRGALRPDIYYLSRVRLLVLENTHNMGGGTLWPLDRYREVVGAARDAGLRVHLDGARIFNAAAATGRPASDWGREADTVMFCLSKGLGAPVGSLLCGKEGLIREARRVRKMLGGGMRQVGVLAAAGLVAIEEGIGRLSEDHALASRLAEGLKELGAATGPCDTNIVVADLRERGVSAQEFLETLSRAGIKALAVGPAEVRLVTHRDVDPGDVERALEAAADAL